MRRHFRRALLAAFVAAVSVAGARAQAVSLGGHNTDAPIAVSADNFTGDLKTKVGTYEGNVIVSQGDFKLHADKVRVVVVKGKPGRIVASGHVLFAAPAGNASGSEGVYDLASRTVTLTGDVVLTKDKDVLRGTQLSVNLVTGKARLEARGTAGGRVQGLFTPPKRTGNGGKK